MSQESYLAGFCKTAEAHGVDPAALAEYAVKTAKDETGMLAQALDWIKNKANQFEGMHPSTRALIGAGVGGAAGGGLGAAIKGKKGVGTGAAIGALVGGGAGAVPWRDLAKSLDDYIAKRKREKMVTDAKEGITSAVGWIKDKAKEGKDLEKEVVEAYNNGGERAVYGVLSGRGMEDHAAVVLEALKNAGRIK